jgi:hypothetical protein
VSFGPSRRSLACDRRYYDRCCLLTARHGSPHVALAFASSATPRYAGQPSPDKNVNCPCTSSSFTWLPCWERLRDAWPTRLGNPAFYDVSVRSLAGLGSGFLPTVGRPSAVAFASYFVDRSYPLGILASLRLPVSYRGLAPHKFTPMPGVPKNSGRVAYGHHRFGDSAFTRLL